MITTVDYAKSTDLILQARYRVYVSLPGIHEELAHALVEAAKRGSEVRVVLDCSEESVRNGYGDLPAIEALRAAGITVYDFPKNLISFLISDERGYLIFPESRIFALDDTGTNAVELDRMTLLRLVSTFFPPIDASAREKITAELKRSVAELTAEQEMLLESGTPPPFDVVDPAKVEEVKRALAENPLVHPDLQRRIRTYTAKIQFVELHFDGKNIGAAKVSIPADALPFKDELLRKSLETRLRLFQNMVGNERFKALSDFLKSEDVLRREFLVPIASREKSVISIGQKQAFVRRIEELRSQIKDVRTKTIEAMTEEVLNSSDRVKKEVLAFLRENPPEGYERFQESLFERKAEALANRVVGSIKFPEPEDLLGKMAFRVNFYDLTWDDFKDEEFLKELAEKGVLSKGEVSDIVSMRDAFASKPVEPATSQ